MVWFRGLLLFGWTFLATMTANAAPPAAGDVNEMQAREAFATGKYDQALELYGKLYARTLHPTYLRNIGRCYQYLGRPDPAINTFRDYLRKARDVSADERAEVEGFIKEMEALKREQAEAAARPTDKALNGSGGPALGAGNTGTTAPGGVSMQPTPPPPQADTGERKGSRWWWWAVGGAVVAAAAVGTAAALGAFSSKPSCTSVVGVIECK
jgi:hypothetical protein